MWEAEGESERDVCIHTVRSLTTSYSLPTKLAEGTGGYRLQVGVGLGLELGLD